MLEFTIANWDDDYTAKPGAASNQTSIADLVITKTVVGIGSDGKQQLAISLSDNSEIIFVLPSFADRARIIYRRPPKKK